MILVRYLDTAVTAVTTRLSVERWSLAGASVFRIGFGIAGLLYYLTNHSDRRYFWGPDGVFPDHLFRSSLMRPAFSLYEHTTSVIAFELVFHLGIVVAIAFTLGAGGRWLTALHYLFLFSLYLRNPVLLDGGDNLAFLVLLMMIPADLRAHMAIRPSLRAPTPTATVLHNVAVLAAIVQLCTMYLVSGLNKVQGQMWQDGTAFYYVMMIPEYSWPLITDQIVANAPLVVAITYFTVFFQVLFPGLIVSPTLRPFAVAMGVAFHIGIALFMGLVIFAIYMIATEALLLKDSHYAWLTRGKLGTRGALGAEPPRRSTAQVSGAPVDHHPPRSHDDRTPDRLVPL